MSIRHTTTEPDYLVMGERTLSTARLSGQNQAQGGCRFGWPDTLLESSAFKTQVIACVCFVDQGVRGLARTGIVVTQQYGLPKTRLAP